MKEIRLIPDEPLHNYVEISVIDFPAGRDEEPRRRCKVKVEFAKVDVEQLKKRGLGYREAVETYQKKLYDVIKFHLAQDWECEDGYEDDEDNKRKSLGLLLKIKRGLWQRYES